MTIKKTTKATTSSTAEAPSRTKISLKKDSLKDLSAGRPAKAVKGGANYTRMVSGAL